MNKIHSPLWQRIQAQGLTTLAVMGMTKNTGKTVALNHLLAQAATAQVVVGVTSIGRDGEDRDMVFAIPKPPILVWPGTLVATAQATLQRAKVRYKLIDSTGIDSPMGEVLMVKVLEYGEMEIAGASRSSDQLKVIGRLKQCGASLVLLDGALGRSHHASPAIADGVILATGAAIGGGIGDVIRKTRDRLAILGIAQADEATRVLCELVFAQGGVGLWNGAGESLLLANIATLNAAETLLPYAQSDLTTIALSGAVGRSVWRALSTLATLRPSLTVVVADGTKLFVEATDLVQFAQLGAHILAYRGINLTGITLNPFSPMGGSFDAQEFLGAARLAFAGYGVTDVMLEEQGIGVEPSLSTQRDDSTPSSLRAQRGNPCLRTTKMDCHATLAMTDSSGRADHALTAPQHLQET